MLPDPQAEVSRAVALRRHRSARHGDATVYGRLHQTAFERGMRIFCATLHPFRLCFGKRGMGYPDFAVV
jgi:hypothetical protein